MATANLSNGSSNINTQNDSIIIVDNFQSIRGGRTLAVAAFTPDVIPAGHVIIQETATGDYKPMPVVGNAYDALPAGHTYAGINISSIPKTKPFAGILVRGTVNPVPMVYPIAPILAAVKAALGSGVDFRQD
jgi:hypothetical protein